MRKLRLGTGSLAREWASLKPWTWLQPGAGRDRVWALQGEALGPGWFAPFCTRIPPWPPWTPGPGPWVPGAARSCVLPGAGASWEATALLLSDPDFQPPFHPCPSGFGCCLSPRAALICWIFSFFFFLFFSLSLLSFAPDSVLDVMPFPVLDYWLPTLIPIVFRFHDNTASASPTHPSLAVGAGGWPGPRAAGPFPPRPSLSSVCLHALCARPPRPSGTPSCLQCDSGLFVGLRFPKGCQLPQTPPRPAGPFPVPPAWVREQAGVPGGRGWGTARAASLHPARPSSVEQARPEPTAPGAFSQGGATVGVPGPPGGPLWHHYRDPSHPGWGLTQRATSPPTAQHGSFCSQAFQVQGPGGRPFPAPESPNFRKWSPRNASCRLRPPRGPQGRWHPTRPGPSPAQLAPGCR
ncbi:atrophin-1-like [Ictidomys tridecemlineatus]|nr:atrophin-1-like [Ictidomys tridecemlineatus]